jgi:flavin-dependent dehydrogenase
VLVAGDAGHMVDPFIGEGIYYAVRSGQLAAKAVESALEGGPERLKSYDEMVSEELYPDFKANEGLVNLIYNHPRLWYRAVELEPGIMERYYEVIRGEKSAVEFYGELKRKVMRKPWKFVSLWLRSGTAF